MKGEDEISQQEINTEPDGFDQPQEIRNLGQTKMM